MVFSLTFRGLRLRAFALAAVFAGSVLPALALVGSNSGPNIFNGLYINEQIGAGTFYSMGFSGANAVVANIEAGSIWNGHETLGNVTTYISDPSVTGTSLGQFDWHATMVGQTIAGNGMYTYQDGIAPQATLWSAAIATAWNPDPKSDYTGSFEITDQTFTYAYKTAMQTGITVNGTTVKADVINSSWGFSDPAGTNSYTVFLDSLLKANNVVGVFAAGNEGPGTNSVGGPASGFNGISVAALTGDKTTPAYSQVAEFSSRGPGDFYNPATGTTETVRPVVDIAAPGGNLTLSFYGGVTGGHTSGTDPTGGNGTYYVPNMDGTSFAAPTVAGAAALMVDAGKAFGVANMTNPLVIKAALMAGAARTSGWNNGQVLQNGALVTTQAVDYAAGAGALDLNSTYRIFVGDPAITITDSGISAASGVNATLGVSGGAGGSVLSRGWDYGLVKQGAPNNYGITESLAAGGELTVALTWFAGTYGDLLTTAQTKELANLSLELWQMDPAPSGSQLIARSAAPASTIEYLRITIPETGIYMVRIVWDGFNFSLASALPQTNYAVAWNFNPTAAVVPEPATVALLIFAVCSIGLIRWRHRNGSGRSCRS
jgi:hypothetical protein